MKSPAKTRVLFVCLGNICRSPTAHGVFETMLQERGLGSVIEVDSCGTGGWHAGSAPDSRAVAEASGRGYDLGGLRARQVMKADFDRFDYILAMDRMNLAELEDLCPPDYSGHLGLFLSLAPHLDEDEVPDPYYGGAQGFGHVLDLVERASEALLREICDARVAR